MRSRFVNLLPPMSVLLAALVRFWGLARESIWLDEATSIMIARMDVRSLIEWVAADIHPPLYYLLLHGWIALGQSELVVRSLSVLFGVGTVAVTWALARELFDSQVALFSTLLLALSPLHVFYSQEARMYVAAAMWSTLGSYLLLLALRRRSRFLWWGYLVANACALYTHYFALFALLFQALYALLYTRKGGEGNRAFRPWLWSTLGIGLTFLPWLPTLVRQVLGGGGGWVERSIGKPSIMALVDTWLQFSIGLEGRLYPAIVRRAAYLLFAALLLGAVITALRSRRDGVGARYRDGVLFCVAAVVLPLGVVWLVSQWKPMYTTRYLLPFLPAYCIWTAAGLRALKWKGLRLVAASALLLILATGVWYTYETLQKPDWRSATAYVVSYVQPGDVGLFSPRWNYKPFDYYAPGRLELDLDLPVPTTEESAQAAVSDIARKYKRVWFFWEEGHYGDPRGIAKTLLDQRFQPLETTQFPGVDSVILYQVQTAPLGAVEGDR